MRLIPLLVVCAICASPAQAAIGSARIDADRIASAFTTQHLNDAELAGVVGTGGVSGFSFFRDATATNARLVEQQNAQLLVTTSDNWFTDVGTPLIFANIAGSH